MPKKKYSKTKRTITKDEIKNKVLEMIKQDSLAPWCKTWTDDEICPVNALTGKTYRGMNFLLGYLLGNKLGSMVFGTSKQ